MNIDTQSLERQFFRGLNSVVEPLVRKGVGSPRLLPGALVVLETVGFKSGLRRRTPLASFRLGKYVLVSTVRGERSFWVKNLHQQLRARYYLGGRARDCSVVVVGSQGYSSSPALDDSLAFRLAGILERFTRGGLTFAVLVAD